MIVDRSIKLVFMLISLVLSVVLLPVAQAVSIGEVIVHSRWSEPLRAQVELRVNSSELVEESCLSLIMPDAQDDDASIYLTKALLSIKREMGRQFVTINTNQPFKEMFAKVRLQVKCANSGGMTKVLTILPDLGTTEVLPVSELNSQVTQQASANPAVPTEVNPATTPTAKVTSAGGAPQKKSHSPRKSHKSSVKTSAKPTLQVSSGQADLTKLEQAGGNQKELLAKLKELNTDDQIAAMLAMQNELQQLRNEINQIKAKTPPSTATPVVAPIVTAPVVATSIEYGPSFWLGILSGLLLLGLLGWRYYSRRREEAAQMQNQAADETPDINSVSAGVDGSVASLPATSKAELGELTQKISAFAESQHNVSEEDLVMEEAQLYAAHNRPQKAIEMLGELIDAHPEKMDAWLSLFTNYASLNEVDRFAQLAQRLKLAEPDQHTWALVQSLGRTLDRGNPLYKEQNQNAVPTPINTVEAEATEPVADSDRFKSLDFDLDLTRSKKTDN